MLNCVSAVAAARECDRTCTKLFFPPSLAPQSLCESLRIQFRNQSCCRIFKKRKHLPDCFSELQSGLHETFRLKGDVEKNMESGFDDITHKRPCGTCRRLDVTTVELQVLCRALDSLKVPRDVHFSFVVFAKQTGKPEVGRWATSGPTESRQQQLDTTTGLFIGSRKIL